MATTSLAKRLTPRIKAYLAGRIPTPKDLEGYTLWWTKLLLASFGLSLLASLHWSFDLLSHFIVQYAIGGVALTLPLLIFRHRRWAVAALLVSLMSLAEIVLLNTQFPPPSGPTASSPTFTVVQYNRLASNTRHDKVHDWLIDVAPDIVILQEANSSLADMASSLGEVFPHQIQEPRPHPFGQVILSRHPIADAEKIPLGGNFAARIVISHPSLGPITLYALHAYPPLGSRRDRELRETIRKMREVKAKRTLFAGDWNLTPYSPVFREVLETTGLNYAHTGWGCTPTWPAFLFLPFLQIPIDHILYSGDLRPISKERGPSLGSDHYPLIMTFEERTNRS